MKTWQRIWLYLVIIYATLHFFRDVFQDLGIKNFLSTILVRQTPSKFPQLWFFVNTYVIELGEITLAMYCLHKNRFGAVGYSTIGIALATFAAWYYYWFFL